MTWLVAAVLSTRLSPGTEKATPVGHCWPDATVNEVRSHTNEPAAASMPTGSDTRMGVHGCSVAFSAPPKKARRERAGAVTSRPASTRTGFGPQASTPLPSV